MADAARPRMKFMDVFDPAVSGDVIGVLMIILALVAALAVVFVSARELVRSRRRRSA